MSKREKGAQLDRGRLGFSGPSDGLFLGVMKDYRAEREREEGPFNFD